MRVLKNARANIENKRKIFLEIGFVITLALVIAAFEFRTFEPYKIPETGFTTEFIEEDVTEITFQKPKPPETIPQRRPTLINIVENSEDINDTPDIDASDDFDAPNQNWEPPMDDEPEIVDPNRIFVGVEEDPEFPGGLNGLYTYFKNNVKYPLLASQSGIEGLVFINFVVEPNGSISSVTVLRGIGGGCDEEAVRIVENMPVWEPGRQSGKAVRVSFTVPIKFTLQ